MTRAIIMRAFQFRALASWVMVSVIPPASAGGFWWGVRATPVVRPQKPLAEATGMTRAIIMRAFQFRALGARAARLTVN